MFVSFETAFLETFLSSTNALLTWAYFNTNILSSWQSPNPFISTQLPGVCILLSNDVEY